MLLTGGLSKCQVLRQTGATLIESSIDSCYSCSKIGKSLDYPRGGLRRFVRE